MQQIYRVSYCLVALIIQKAIYERPYDYFEKFQTICRLQLGFLKFHSMSHNLANYASSARDFFDRGEYASAMQTTFNTVNKDILLRE